MADADRRISLLALRLRLSWWGGPAGRRRERARPTLWRRHQNPAPQLGLSRLLRRVLPAASTLDRYRSTDRFSQQPEPHLRPTAQESAITNISSAWRFLFVVGCSTIDSFQTSSRNWLDHSNIGESNLFWPLTWDYALIQGWETTLRSPRLWRRAQFHLAYSNQIAQASAPFTGGLICPVPVSADCEPPPGFSPVDHDQRNTLNLGVNGRLPWQVFASTNVYYGSGFTNGLPDAQYPGNYLPQHTTFDISLGKSFGEKDKYRLSLDGSECGESARIARQQPDVWRIPLQRPAGDLRRVPLEISLLSESLHRFEAPELRKCRAQGGCTVRRYYGIGPGPLEEGLRGRMD